MKIKLIIFDLSNVCFSDEEIPFIKIFCQRHNLDLKKFDEEYQYLLKQSEVDEISGTEVWLRILKKYNINDNSQNIILEMMKRKYANEDVLNIVKKIKDDGHKVVYLTNYSKDYWTPIKKRWGMEEFFSGGIVSFEIKARKPDALGFKTLMNKFGASPVETLFIDDSESNLIKAKELGINIHQFKGVDELKSFLSKTINEIKY